MIKNLKIEYRIDYQTQRGAARHVDIHETIPVEIPVVDLVPRLAIEIRESRYREGEARHFWFEIDGLLYRRDDFDAAGRLRAGGPPFGPSLDASVSMEEFDLGGLAKRVIASGREQAVAMAAEAAAGMRLHDGVLYFPSDGPILRLTSNLRGRKVDSSVQIIEVVPEHLRRPNRLEGRCFGLQDLRFATGFAYDCGYQIAAMPRIDVHDDRFAELHLGDGPLLATAASFFDRSSFNRDIGNTPFHYVDALLRYHAMSDTSFISDEMLDILLDAAAHPGQSDYKNDVRARFLDAVDTIRFHVCLRNGWSAREMSARPDDVGVVDVPSGEPALF